MKGQDDVALLYRIAQNYYIHEYSQNEIANMENISRSQISRLLKRARNIGIIDIKVSLPVLNTIEELDNKLTDTFGLDKVVISKSYEDEKQNNTALYFTAGEYLRTVLPRFKNIGIGWGKTLHSVASSMEPYQSSCDDMTFYSIAGNSGNNNPYLQTNTITSRFAECFNANVFYNNELTFTEKESFNETSIKRRENLKKKWKNLDAIVISIGGKVSTNKLYIDEIPTDFYSKSLVEKIAGDVLANFYLYDTSVLNMPEEYELISMSVSEISKIKNSICIANGDEKVDALVIALKNKLFKTLITDEKTAKLLVENIDM